MSDEPKKEDFGSFVTGYTMAERVNFPELSFTSYVKLVEPLAKEVENETGIAYQLPMIQSAHESRSGNSQLAKEYGNLFGFKATDAWKKNGNPVAKMPTWEVITTESKDKYFEPFDANKALPPDCPYWKIPELLEKWVEKDNQRTMYRLKIYVYQEFRVYDTWRHSFFDWGRLISTAKVYAESYKLLTNRETVRDGIKKMAATYATDLKYSQSLLALYDQVTGAGPK